MSYGRMPFGWIINGGLRQFSAAEATIGREITALKSYLTIAGFLDWKNRETVLSIFDIQGITGASKPMVSRGLRLLEDRGLVIIHNRADLNTNVYELGAMENHYRKVPQDVIGLNLKQLGNRGAVSLAALKLYVAMLYHRNEKTGDAAVSHQTLVNETGVRPELVKNAYKVLHTCGFVTVSRSSALRELSASGFATNAYKMHGDFTGLERAVRRPGAIRSRQRKGILPWAD